MRSSKSLVLESAEPKSEILGRFELLRREWRDSKYPRELRAEGLQLRVRTTPDDITIDVFGAPYLGYTQIASGRSPLRARCAAREIGGLTRISVEIREPFPMFHFVILVYVAVLTLLLVVSGLGAIVWLFIAFGVLHCAVMWAHRKDHLGRDAEALERLVRNIVVGSRAAAGAASEDSNVVVEPSP